MPSGTLQASSNQLCTNELLSMLEDFDETALAAICRAWPSGGNASCAWPWVMNMGRFAWARVRVAADFRALQILNATVVCQCLRYC